jgi:hypothetical protein
MSEVLIHAQALLHQEAMLILSGLVLVFVFQLVVFREVERTNLVTTMYFATTIALIVGPFARALVETPDRAFNMADREVAWTFLSFLATLLGIACSRPPQRSPVAGSAPASANAQLGSAQTLPT